ncbi:MAG: DUF4436 domain-containing protein [Nannocystaceae bacterium]|nr:DUF4436 domain-containing protein [Nannocystaceae bacterium]
MLEGRRLAAVAAIVTLCATLIHWGSVDGGLFLDDVAIYGGLELAKEGHPGARWWDVFFLGAYDEHLRFGGGMPWWVAEDVQLHFFRPAAAATHYLDVLLWGQNTRAMHMQNLGWFAATGAAVFWLYRALLRSREEVILALAAFLLAYIHEWPVQWLAARNSQMALCFGALSLVGFWRWAQGGRWKVLAIAGLALSLLSAELGVSVLAFVVGMELDETRRGDSLRARAERVGVAVAVAVVWRVGYVAGGYGAIGAGTYIDPLSAPWVFAREAPDRILTLLLSLVGPPELLVPDAVPLGWRLALWAIGLLSVIVVIYTLRGQRDLRPWMASAVLCLVPLVSSIPQPRLLGFAMLAIAPLVARVLCSAHTKSGLYRVAAGVLVAHQFLLGPLLVLGALDGIRPRGGDDLGGPGAELGDLEGRNLFLLNPPTYALAMTVGAVRATRGLSMPRFAWVLGVGAEVDITREGCCTVVLRSNEGMFDENWAAMYRGPQVPFEKGAVVTTLAFEANVRAVTDRGLAQEVAFEFGGPLRSPQYVFARWDGRDFQVVRPKDIPRRRRGSKRRRRPTNPKESSRSPS